MMGAQALADEQLRDQAIQQALAGDPTSARQTIRGMVDRRYLREVWQMMLFVESDRGDVEAVKDTILSCPDPSLLASHFYRELPLVFVRAGDTSGAIEIAKTMGNYGVFPLIGIAAHLAEEGDVVGVREALAHIGDEEFKISIMNKMYACHSKNKNLEALSAHCC
jgi:hypothetical protein